jgi:hypothetical protein
LILKYGRGDESRKVFCEKGSKGKAGKLKAKRKDDLESVKNGFFVLIREPFALYLSTFASPFHLNKSFRLFALSFKLNQLNVLLLD